MSKVLIATMHRDNNRTSTMQSDTNKTGFNVNMSGNNKSDLINPDGQLRGVDLVKYAMAFCVIAIHVQTPTEQFAAPIKWLISLAVPFFFITSGFLLMRKMHGGSEISFLRRRSAKLFRLFAIWTALYIPLAIIAGLLSHTPFVQCLTDNLRWVLVKGETAYSWPLWFVYSTAIATLLLSLVYKSRLLTILLVVVMALSEVTYYYDFIPSQIDKYLPLRTLGGGIYMVSGMYVYRLLYKNSNTRGLTTIILILTVASLVIFNLKLPFSNLLGGLGLFLLAYSSNPRISQAGCLTLRTRSMWIYYLHMYFVYSLMVISARIGMGIGLWLRLSIVSLAAWCAAVAISRLQRKPRLSFIGYLVR